LRWRAGNSRHIQTLLGLARTLLGCLEAGLPDRPPCAAAQRPTARPGGPGSEDPTTRVLTVNDFLFATGLDNINLFQLLRRAARHRSRFPFSNCLHCFP